MEFQVWSLALDEVVTMDAQVINSWILLQKEIHTISCIVMCPQVWVLFEASVSQSYLDRCNDLAYYSHSIHCLDKNFLWPAILI